MYLDRVLLNKNTSTKILSERMAGLTGADIANICNQAKINAIQSKKKSVLINEKEIQSAIDEIMIGREKRERSLNNVEKARVSYHEAGHAFLSYVLENCESPLKVSIIPRGEAALGFSQQKSNDNKIYLQETILNKIAVLLGGRCAEKIIYGNYSTGASDDIEKLSELSYNYIYTWGMDSNISPVNPKSINIKINDNKIFENCQLLIKNIENKVLTLLSKNKENIQKIAKSLLKNEVIEYESLKNLLTKRKENSINIYNIKINNKLQQIHH